MDKSNNIQSVASVVNNMEHFNDLELANSQDINLDSSIIAHNGKDASVANAEEVEIRDYKLNEDKTWDKIEQALNRSTPIVTKITRGGIVLTFQAGNYILFRKAIN